MDFHSIILKSSASNFHGVPERDPSLDSKIIGFKLSKPIFASIVSTTENKAN